MRISSFALGRSSGVIRSITAILATAFLLTAAKADLFRRNGELIPGTEDLIMVRGAQLDNLELRELDARLVNLSGASFESSDLTGATFVNSSIANANFTGAIIAETHLGTMTMDQFYSTQSYQEKNVPGVILANNGENWDLSGLNLKSAVLSADFSNADLTAADLENASINGDFSGANLPGANITNATIGFDTLNSEQVYSTASYKSRNLQGVRFACGCLFFAIPFDLTGWNFRNQDLTGSRMEFADGTNADFSEAILSGSDLDKSTFVDTSFANSDLSDASLFAANFQGANLSGASLVGSDLTGLEVSESTTFRQADLQNANLSLVKNLNPQMFDSASRYNQWTVFPDGFDPVGAGLDRIDWIIGDFDTDQTLGIGDLDRLVALVARGEVFVERSIEVDGLRVIVDDGRVVYDFESQDELDVFVADLLRKFTNVESKAWLESMFDLTGDNRIDQDDLSVWVSDIKQTWLGDANLDRSFNTGDLTKVFQANEYEDQISNNSTWSTGDWNADGEFDSGDLVAAFADGGFEQGPRNAVMVVPEPGSTPLLLACLLTAWISDRHRRTPFKR